MRSIYDIKYICGYRVVGPNELVGNSVTTTGVTFDECASAIGPDLRRYTGSYDFTTLTCITYPFPSPVAPDNFYTNYITAAADSVYFETQGWRIAGVVT